MWCSGLFIAMTAFINIPRTTIMLITNQLSGKCSKSSLVLKSDTVVTSSSKPNCSECCSNRTYSCSTLSLLWLGFLLNLEVTANLTPSFLMGHGSNRKLNEIIKWTSLNADQMFRYCALLSWDSMS